MKRVKFSGNTNVRKCKRCCCHKPLKGGQMMGGWTGYFVCGECLNKRQSKVE